jgi:hypothetical protein
MKHVPGSNRSRRLNQSYTEALASLGDPKNIYGALEETTRILLTNLESRIEWKIRDAEARKQRQPVSLTAEMAELERIGRIHAGLQDPRLIEFRTGDPDAGAAEICRILQLARREYGSEKTEGPEGAKDKDAPDGMEKEEGEGSDKINQNQTVERPPELGSIIANRGKVRRTSG